MTEKIEDIKSKNQLDLKMIPIGIIKPIIGKPKFDQRYANFLLESPFHNTRCEGCMHFIEEEDAPNQCQIVMNSPLGIRPESYCRLWRDVSELEGYIPEDIDDTLPPDVMALIEDRLRNELNRG